MCQGNQRPALFDEVSEGSYAFFANSAAVLRRKVFKVAFAVGPAFNNDFPRGVRENDDVILPSKISRLKIRIGDVLVLEAEFAWIGSVRNYTFLEENSGSS